MSVENARRILQRERNPHLFRALRLRTVTARNRIMMSPMCQYSAEDGLPNQWHSHHLATRAVGGAGIVCVEASHVEARGRITKYCLGLWNDAQRDRLAAIAARCRAFNSRTPAARDPSRARGKARSRCNQMTAPGRRSAPRLSPMRTASRRRAKWTHA
jgi:hypothetical protein